MLRNRDRTGISLGESVASQEMRIPVLLLLVVLFSFSGGALEAGQSVFSIDGESVLVLGEEEDAGLRVRNLDSGNVSVLPYPDKWDAEDTRSLSRSV